MRKLLFIITLMLLGEARGFAVDPPVIFFTDLASGPNSGGDNVSGFAGAYVTIFGNFFGASQGTSTVKWGGLDCLRVVPAVGNYTGWGMTWMWYQKIIVQLGSSCTAGVGSFQITVGGQMSNTVSFTVRTGNIYFVSTTGSDAANGSFATPWLTIIHAVQTAGITAGNTIYAMTGLSQTADDGQGWNASLTLRDDWCLGTASNPNAFVAYPGASVQIGTTSAGTPLYGIRSTTAPGPPTPCRGYWTFANLNLRGSTLCVAVGGPSQGWRWIGNDITNPGAPGSSGGGAAAFETSLNQPNTSGTLANGDTLKMYGNNAHDLNGTSSDELYHGVYFSTDSNHVDMGWNTVANVRGCRGIHTHSSPLGSGYPMSGYPMYDIQIHDNIVHDTQCDGMDIDTLDQSKGAVLIYNNVVYNAGKGPATAGGGGAFDGIASPDSGDENFSNGKGHGTTEVYNNTVYAYGLFTSPPYPGYQEQGIVEWQSQLYHADMFLRARNNIIYGTVTSNYPSGTAYWAGYDPNIPNWCGGTQPNSASCPYITGLNNLLFGGSGASFNTANITGSVLADPLIVSTSSKDFHLQVGSPAIGAGVSISGLTYDIDGRIRPATPSIGAYEGVAGAAPPPSSYPACAPTMFAILLSLISVFVMTL